MITAPSATAPPTTAPRSIAPQRRLFSIWYVLAILLFITTLAHYAVTYHNRFTIGDVLASPASYVGMNLSVTGPYGGSDFGSVESSAVGKGTIATAGSKAAGSFYVIYNQKPVSVYYNQTYIPPHWGEVSVYGTVQADGSLYARRIHNYNYNYLLYFLSFFAGGGVLLFFLHEWKITWRGIRERKDHTQGGSLD